MGRPEFQQNQITGNYPKIVAQSCAFLEYMDDLSVNNTYRIEQIQGITNSLLEIYSENRLIDPEITKVALNLLERNRMLLGGTEADRLKAIGFLPLVNLIVIQLNKTPQVIIPDRNLSENLSFADFIDQKIISLQNEILNMCYSYMNTALDYVSIQYGKESLNSSKLIPIATSWIMESHELLGSIGVDKLHETMLKAFEHAGWDSTGLVNLDSLFNKYISLFKTKTLQIFNTKLLELAEFLDKDGKEAGMTQSVLISTNIAFYLSLKLGLAPQAEYIFELVNKKNINKGQSIVLTKLFVEYSKYVGIDTLKWKDLALAMFTYSKTYTQIPPHIAYLFLTKPALHKILDLDSKLMLSSALRGETKKMISQNFSQNAYSYLRVLVNIQGVDFVKDLLRESCTEFLNHYGIEILGGDPIEILLSYAYEELTQAYHDPLKRHEIALHPVKDLLTHIMKFSSEFRQYPYLNYALYNPSGGYNPSGVSILRLIASNDIGRILVNIRNFILSEENRDQISNGLVSIVTENLGRLENNSLEFFYNKFYLVQGDSQSAFHYSNLILLSNLAAGSYSNYIELLKDLKIEVLSKNFTGNVSLVDHYLKYLEMLAEFINLDPLISEENYSECLRFIISEMEDIGKRDLDILEEKILIVAIDNFNNEPQVNGATKERISKLLNALLVSLSQSEHIKDIKGVFAKYLKAKDKSELDKYFPPS